MEYKGGDLMDKANRPVKHCGNCKEYDGNRCTKEWNNLDDCYYIPWRDDKEPDDCCDDWEYLSGMEDEE